MQASTSKVQDAMIITRGKMEESYCSVTLQGTCLNRYYAICMELC